MSLRTEKQRQASRENGKKSRGPTSGRGCRTSALTRLQHALCARAVVLANESRENFIAVLASLRKHHRPESSTEEALIEQLAANFWRLRRVRALETELLNQSLPAFSPAPPSDAPSPLLAAFDSQIQRTAASYSSLAEAQLRNLRVDESRLQGAFNRALRTLDLHRAGKQRNPAKPRIDEPVKEF